MYRFKKWDHKTCVYFALQRLQPTLVAINKARNELIDNLNQLISNRAREQVECGLNEALLSAIDHRGIMPDISQANWTMQTLCIVDNSQLSRISIGSSGFSWLQSGAQQQAFKLGMKDWQITLGIAAECLMKQCVDIAFQSQPDHNTLTLRPKAQVA